MMHNSWVFTTTGFASTNPRLALHHPDGPYCAPCLYSWNSPPIWDEIPAFICSFSHVTVLLIGPSPQSVSWLVIIYRTAYSFCDVFNSALRTFQSRKRFIPFQYIIWLYSKCLFIARTIFCIRNHQMYTCPINVVRGRFSPDFCMFVKGSLGHDS